MVRRRDRTFTGCWKCRARKVKCDETKPGCRACQRIGAACTGYDAKFSWVGDDDQTIFSQGRRILPCEATWKGFAPLSSDLVDFLISECDEDTDFQTFSTRYWKLPSHNPFSVFAAALSRDSDRREQPDSLSRFLPPPSMSIVPSPHCTKNERYLFNHYVNHVAGLMMPYDHPRNPWKNHYPAAALELFSSRQTSLFNAILAHAAYNVAYLRGKDPDMLRIGSRYYGHAIQELADIMGKKNINFSAAMASIMTLLFAELYGGRSRPWRHHFEGAWTLLKSYGESQSWKSTDLVGVSLQSLNVIKIIGDTSKRTMVSEQSHNSTGERPPDRNSTDPILSGSEFGFTIGSSRSILDCIARISAFRVKPEKDRSENDVDQMIQSILPLLNSHLERGKSCHSLSLESLFPDSGSDTHPEELLGAPNQHQAFIHATYIYLYRSLLNVPPEAVRSHVKQTFAHVSAFFTRSNGNFSIWPAFIAAVEAVTEEDLASAKEWLTRATSFGIRSRVAIKEVVEEIWRRRDMIAITSGLSRGVISIDWRSVMQEFDYDVLLV